MPYCVQYMEQLRDTMVFRFCAIPQIMAAGTLGLCYNNGKVFEGAGSCCRMLWERKQPLGLCSP